MITNLKTSLSGIPAFIIAVYTAYNALKSHQMPTKEDLEIIGGALSFVWLAIQAKDKNVTGGTVPQTLEAIIRVETPEVITRVGYPPTPPARPRA